MHEVNKLLINVWPTLVEITKVGVPNKSQQRTSKYTWSEIPMRYYHANEMRDCVHGMQMHVFSSRSLYVVVRPFVVCLSVTFVHRTQAIEIFGNISTPFGALAICWLLGKILRRSFQGNPSVGEVERERGIAEYCDFGSIEHYISEKVQDRS